MPKIITDAYNSILQTAKEELINNPEKFNMRQIAKKSHVAVGTIYHYFPDKINLIAAILIEDWKREYEEVEEELKSSSTIDDIVLKIYKLVLSYMKENKNIFNLYKGEEVVLYLNKFHKMFISQIKDLYQKGKANINISLNEEEDEMIAEMIITVTRNEKIKLKTLIEMIKDIEGGNHEKRF